MSRIDSKLFLTASQKVSAEQHDVEKTINYNPKTGEGGLQTLSHIEQKYKYLLESANKYDEFVSKLISRYGSKMTKIGVATKLPGAKGTQKKETIDVGYIRKSMAQDGEIYPVIKKVAPAIVQVTAKGKNGSGWSGSGAIVDLHEIFPNEQIPPGTYGIITNNHVTPPDETKYLAVTLANGTVLNNVKVLKSKTADIGTQDSIVDVSLIVVQSSTPLPTLSLATEPPRQGEVILAVGHPLGLPKASFTRGIISHTDQETGEAVFAIQHDAEINPGNSGGPLVNMNGEILGLNTFTFLESNGLSFAIPIQSQVDVLRGIYKNGEFVRGDFGFSVGAFTPFERFEKNFPENLPAAKINWVDYGSAAHKLGLKTGDIITSIKTDDGSTLDINIDNGFEITRFLAWMHRQKPGATIHMTVYKYSKEEGQVKYMPVNISLPTSKLVDNKTKVKSDIWGFLVEKNSKGQPFITEVDEGSPAAKAGISGGKWLLFGIEAKEINGKPVVVSDLNKLKQMLITLNNKDAEMLNLYLIDATDPKNRKTVNLSRNDLYAYLSLDSVKESADIYIAA